VKAVETVQDTKRALAKKGSSERSDSY